MFTLRLNMTMYRRRRSKELKVLETILITPHRITSSYATIRMTICREDGQGYVDDT
jgi:hypothetical protein